MTDLVELTKDFIRFGNYNDETFRAINDILKLSVTTDTNIFNDYKNYIKTRLFQIALEIKSGIPESYRSAVIPYKHEVIMAESNEIFSKLDQIGHLRLKFKIVFLREFNKLCK